MRVLVPLLTFPPGDLSDALAPRVAHVARHLSADVHALVLDLIYPLATTPLSSAVGGVAELIEATRSQSRDHGSALVATLARALAESGRRLTSSEVEVPMFGFADAVGYQARYHDLTVIPLGNASRDVQAIAEGALFGSGRPALLLPTSRNAPSAFRHGLIAWDGSRAAARALADGLGLLERAESVTIAAVLGEKPLPDEMMLDRLQSYLESRNITPAISRIPHRGAAVGQALGDHAREIGADFIVMGGFGHSRVRDFVLGGATRYMLANATMPVLLSH